MTDSELSVTRNFPIAFCRCVLGMLVCCAVFVGSLGMTSPLDDQETPWVLDCCSPFRICADMFHQAGFTEDAAEILAHTVMFGEAPSSEQAGCSYYVVTQYYCVNGVRYYKPIEVQTKCIEEGMNACPIMDCPLAADGSAQRPFFLTRTASGCDPSNTCVWLEVSGPFDTNNLEKCASIGDCSCWPNVNCDSRECRPLVGINTRRPRGCPTCAP